MGTATAHDQDEVLKQYIRILDLELSTEYSIEDSFCDREETIDDYMFNCGYTRKEAINAYNKTIEDERQH